MSVSSQAIAYELLIELLVHQFAFPVRWIETQDHLLTVKTDLARLVELGPSSTLTSMARKTRDAKIAAEELPSDVQIAFLASTKQIKELCYIYEGTKEAEVVAFSPNSVIAPQQLKDNPEVPTAHVITAARLEDSVLTAFDIVRAVVAQKLGRDLEDVTGEVSLKSITGGRSTLQNELVGDLEAEFGSTPDGVEDLSLENLSAKLKPPENSKLGKHSTRLVTRFIASKMPADFQRAAVEQYLQAHWGLGPCRTACLLLIAVTSEPKNRLSSVSAAHEYLNSLISRYNRLYGTGIQALEATAGQSTNKATAVVDEAVTQQLFSRHNKLAEKQMKVLADFLDFHSPATSGKVFTSNMVQDLQCKLDLWHSEFSEDFAVRVSQRFSTKTVRRYNGWWNSARQDACLLLQMQHLASQPDSGAKHVFIDSSPDLLMSRILSRAEQSVLCILREGAVSLVACSSVNSPDTALSRLADRVAIALTQPPKFRHLQRPCRPRTCISAAGIIHYNDESMCADNTCFDYAFFLKNPHPFTEAAMPILKRKRSGIWEKSLSLTECFYTTIARACQDGLTFRGKTVLITGAGANSIGAECARSLLMGGARVIVTTSKSPSDAAHFHRSLYECSGSKESELIVLQSNLCSVKDCKAIVDHIYDSSGLGLDLDAILPFAAVSERGAELDQLSDESELAHRLMLTNVYRLLGAIISRKRAKGDFCRPTQVLLPLSPNHGIFGGDGLYSESKLGLESLLNRVSSESWSDHLSVCGVVIGWTRGTGLMNANDVVAEAIEDLGIVTFHQQEMALNIVALLSTELSVCCEDEPLIADFGGGLAQHPNCKDSITRARRHIDGRAKILKLVNEEDELEQREVSQSAKITGVTPSTKNTPKSRLQLDFPPLPNVQHDLVPLRRLQDMVDLSSVVVVVGYSELSSLGSSRTRWEIEVHNELSQEGATEIAWMMNLIRHEASGSSDSPYVGWIDVKSGERVHDGEIKARYGQEILEHTGLRLVEPDSPGGYDPSRKQFVQEIMIEEDMPTFSTSIVNAEALRLKHVGNIRIEYTGTSDECQVTLLRGATVQVPKASPFEHGLVAGQLPSGWSAEAYGITPDIIKQVDPVTLYTLCCVSEALYSAGISDANEIFQHIHLSELGNFIGSSMGGASKTRQMYRDVYLDHDVQSDIIQETYINTPAAWVNMLLFGSTGPIKTPVGACATGVESIDTAFDSLTSGKVRMCIVGGVDDFHEDESYGFAKMRATANAREQMSNGWLPSEMSRPMSDSRAGFVESHGCGIQLLCTAELAIEMGLPVYAIISGTTMAADKVSRSVPAPGKGVLTFARETPFAKESPVLDLQFRRDQMSRLTRSLAHSSGSETDWSGSDTESSSFTMLSSPASTPSELGSADMQMLKRAWSTNLRVQDPNISPMRAALAVWDLTVDDIAFVSMHGTSTKANDKNEVAVINEQMCHLGRNIDQPLLAICQKAITGHPKAPAAAWMLNGCIQAMTHSVVPGNRQVDNIDPIFRQFGHFVLPTQNIAMSSIKAFLLNSFGFGQKGGQLVGVAPRYLFASIQQNQYSRYAHKCQQRMQVANRDYVKGILQRNVVKLQSETAYRPTEETQVFLDPLARVAGTISGDLRFDLAGGHSAPVSKAWVNQNFEATQANLHTALNISEQCFSEMAGRNKDNVAGLGVDLVVLSSFQSHENETFLERNFTNREQDMALSSLEPRATFAGRWAAKEAVFKSLGVKSLGAGAAMKDIEIIHRDGHGPRVQLSGRALRMAQSRGLREILISLTYGEDSVVAIAMGIK